MGPFSSCESVLPWSDLRRASMRLAIEPREALYEARVCTNLGD